MVLAITTVAERRKEGLQHQLRGTSATAWDEVFVLAYGVPWRAHRDTFKTLAEWMAECTSFIDLICDRWVLPRLPEATSPILSAPIKCSLPCQIDQPPSLSCHYLDNRWQSNKMRLWIQADCKPIADVMCGLPTLQDSAVETVFRKKARYLYRFHHVVTSPL